MCPTTASSRTRRLLARIWNSPALKTWGSFSGPALSIVIIWPVLTTKLPTEEVALWLLFSSIGVLLLMLDLGFTPTLSRLFAYAMGGATKYEIKRLSQKGTAKPSSHSPNWQLLGEVYSSTHVIFRRIAIAGFLIISTVGTVAVYNTVVKTPDTNAAWLSWAIVVTYLTLSLFGRSYAAYLEGTNHIALVKRWDALFSYLNILITLAVLLIGGGLVAIMLVSLFITTAIVLRNRWLCRWVLDGRAKDFDTTTISRSIWNVAWPNAWRSAVGILMSRGLFELSGILYAQFALASELAEYLLALRFIQILSLFSSVPFYTRLPTLSRLRAQRQYDEQVKVAEKSMLLSHMIYVVGFIALSTIGPWFFSAINGNVHFPEQSLWLLFGIAMFAERFGAMHIQLYTTSNHVVWHTLTGTTGSIWIVFSAILFPFYGAQAFPISFIIGYVGYYSWYSAYLVYKTFPITFPNFEFRTSLLPFCLITFYYAYILIS